LVNLEKSAKLVERSLLSLLAKILLGSGWADEAVLVDRFRFLGDIEALIMTTT
jgi:hypothetical protein